MAHYLFKRGRPGMTHFGVVHDTEASEFSGKQFIRIVRFKVGEDFWAVESKNLLLKGSMGMSYFFPDSQALARIQDGFLSNPRHVATPATDFLLARPHEGPHQTVRLKALAGDLGTVLWNSSHHSKRHLRGAVVYPDPKVLETLVERFGTRLSRERLAKGQPLHLHMTMEMALKLWAGSPIRLKKAPDV
jgi:hypothetical protein